MGACHVWLPVTLNMCDRSAWLACTLKYLLDDQGHSAPSLGCKAPHMRCILRYSDYHEFLSQVRFVRGVSVHAGHG